MLETKVGALQEDHPMYREGFQFTAVCACGFASFGWPTIEQAQARSDQHQSEHENADAIREHLDSGNIDAANALMMPPIAEVEALTPEAFPPKVAPQIQNDVNGAWDAVN